MLWYSPLGESRFSEFMLISVGFYTLLEWLTWWPCPRWWAPFIVKGIRVYEMDSITCTDSGSSVMPLCAAWGSDPRGRSLGLGSRESSCQASMGRDMVEVLLICLYFAIVKFSCAAISEWSSTSFFQFPGSVPFLMWSTVENVLSNTIWYWGETFPVMVCNNRDTDPLWNG